MPWCEECAKYWTPNSMNEDGTCPTLRTCRRGADVGSRRRGEDALALQAHGGRGRRVPRLAFRPDGAADPGGGWAGSGRLGARSGRRLLRCSPDGRCRRGVGSTSFVDRSVRERDREFSRVGIQFESPSALVNEVVVAAAGRNEPVQVGVALVGAPFVDVVDLAAIERHVARADAAGAVHRAQGSALIVGGETSAPADIEDHAVAAEHHRQDVGITRESTHGRNRDIGAVIELADRVIP